MTILLPHFAGMTSIMRLPKRWNSLSVCNKLTNHPFLLVLIFLWPIWYHGNWGTNQDPKVCLRKPRAQFSCLPSRSFDFDLFLHASKYSWLIMISFWKSFSFKQEAKKKEIFMKVQMESSKVVQIERKTDIKHRHRGGYTANKTLWIIWKYEDTSTSKFSYWKE